MAYWILSDGTQVGLHGRVRGTTGLAQRLIAEVARIREGSLVFIPWGPGHGTTTVDLKDPNYVAGWVDDRAREYGANIVQTDHPPLGVPGTWKKFPPGTVF